MTDQVHFLYSPFPEGVSELRLIYNLGEELVFRGEGSEDELIFDLISELESFLSDADTTSFYQQQGEIHSLDDYYNEFSRDALYAYLEKLKNNVGCDLQWVPANEEEAKLLYSDENKDEDRKCVGHLRCDFGSTGIEFWTSWFDHLPGLKTRRFRDELQIVVNDLRKPGKLLQNFMVMNKECRKGLPVDRNEYGFHAESKCYSYYLRCIPRHGDYNAYIYCYAKEKEAE